VTYGSINFVIRRFSFLSKVYLRTYDENVSFPFFSDCIVASLDHRQQQQQQQQQRGHNVVRRNQIKSEGRTTKSRKCACHRVDCNMATTPNTQSLIRLGDTRGRLRSPFRPSNRETVNCPPHIAVCHTFKTIAWAYCWLVIGNRMRAGEH